MLQLLVLMLTCKMCMRVELASFGSNDRLGNELVTHLQLHVCDIVKVVAQAENSVGLS